MMMQKTLKGPINCSGVALHSGLKVQMSLCPGMPDSGIVFKRTDISGEGATIPAHWKNVVETTLCTTLGNEDGVTVATVEHLMAAFAGAGIDNAVVEINGPEIPVMDGSAAPFLFLIECAGTVDQDAPRRYIRVLKAISIDDGDKSAVLTPGQGFGLNFEINFDSPAIARQTISFSFADDTFKKEISRARTFGFLHEVEALRAAGLAKGGSLDNAVVVSGETILNEEGLRYDDEFVRHKVLDAIGDLYLAGGPLLGCFHGLCSGHAANNRLLRALFADDAAWRYETLEEQPSNERGFVWSGQEVPAAVALGA